LTQIEIEPAAKEEIVTRIQRYFSDELQQEIGSFDAQFLLDFFSEHVGSFYYNQGLADALKTFDDKLVDISDCIYQLEKDTNSTAR
jgi:uncharacterized protein (DUF2164 family)